MISQRWIQQQKTKLACMRPSEDRDKLAEEIEEAEAERAATVDRLSELKLQTNRYPGNCVVTGKRVQGGEGYIHKNAAGRWDTYSRAGATERFDV